ncbi:hypothetical protein IQ232_13115 [Microcystis aeruginosa LEGE 11464]|jgi:hypothetical protein|uniref:hypothetical protein n=1 Tax=Microcystis TaxID=1125 RepID=UPI001881BCA1|nr:MULTISPECIES: hypothetical protein [Microcystis]MBE9090680.1 hypothetical protein [Microcystis aeruginosa LEGE 11464]MCA2659748.1 hypothetical protein [Microcystis sp. M049S2]
MDEPRFLRLLAFFRQNDEMSLSIFPIIFILNKFIEIFESENPSFKMGIRMLEKKRRFINYR